MALVRLSIIKWKNNKLSEQFQNPLERVKVDTPTTQIHDRCLSSWRDA